MTTERIKVTLEKGQVVMLDDVYAYHGIIPLDAYDQDDIADSTMLNDNDGGETLRMLKTVDIDIKVTVK